MSNLCCCSNCCVNPIIYCFVNDSFQRNMLRTLRCRCLATHPGDVVVGERRAVTGTGARVRRGTGSADVELHAVNGSGSGTTASTTAVTGSSSLRSTVV